MTLSSVIIVIASCVYAATTYLCCNIKFFTFFIIFAPCLSPKSCFSDFPAMKL